MIDVAVGVIFDAGKVFIGARRKGTRYEGVWEFPGGKVEYGEQPSEALVRELREELGIEDIELELLGTCQHCYDDGGSFRIWYYLVRSWRGEPILTHWEEVLWVDVEKLASYPIFDANRSVLPLLQRRIAND